MKKYRVGFIGDVHGRAKEFEAMIEQMEDYGIDRLISLGDIFDRGPDAPRCLRIIKNRGFLKRDGTLGHIEMVLGNHEDRNIRCYRGLPIPGRKKAPTPWAPREFDAITKAEWEWLEQQPFMLKVENGGLDLVAVHGGFTEDMLSPGWYNFDQCGRLARVGYLSEKTGEALSPMQYSKRLWADEYDGRFGRAVYGHTSFSAIRYSKHAVGIDGTKRGKVFGIVISNTEDDVEFERKIEGWSPPKPITKTSLANSRYFPSSDQFVSLFDDGGWGEDSDPFLDEDAWSESELVDLDSARYKDSEFEGLKEFSPEEYERYNAEALDDFGA